MEVRIEHADAGSRRLDDWWPGCRYGGCAAARRGREHRGEHVQKCDLRLG